MTAGSIEVRVNGSARSVRVRAVSELVRDLGLEGRAGIAVAVNGSVVPRWDPLESTCRHASLSIL